MLLWHLNNIAHGHFDVTMTTLHHVSTGYTWKHGQVIAVLIIHGFALWGVLHWAHFTGQKIGQNFFRILLVISVFGTNPLSEPVLAYSLLEPQGQILIRIEKKKNYSYIKLNLQLSWFFSTYHENIDLYHPRQRMSYYRLIGVLIHAP